MLWLARHGETDANAEGRLQGRLDTALSDRGRVQAALVAEALPRDPERVVSSPLARARHTAAAYGYSFTVDERWSEISFGEWEGRNGADLLPELWRRRVTDPDWAPPGGESLPEVARRVTSALAELWDLARDGDVVVFTHASPVKVAVTVALEVPVVASGRMHLYVASISQVRVDPDGRRLISYNDVSHLGAHAVLGPQPP